MQYELTDEKRSMTLTQCIDEMIGQSFFKSMPVRILMATELLNSYNDALSVSKGTSKDLTPVWTPFLNPDLINVISLEKSEDALVCPYYFYYSKLNDIDKQEEFDNYHYASSILLTHRKGFLKEKTLTCGDIIKRYDDDCAVETIIRLLFYTVFGCHPLLGRKYYEIIERSKENERLFFAEPQTMIFDEDNKDNGFINGFHEYQRLMWGAFDDEHKKFWLDFLSGKENDFQVLYKKWHELFDIVISNAKTPCQRIFPAIVFKNNSSIVYSDDFANKETIECWHLPQVSSCGQCKIDHKLASVPKIEATIYKDNDEYRNNSQLVLFVDGRTITRGDIQNTEDNTAIFDVIASKKADIVGLKYLQSRPIIAKCGNISRTYETNGTIALLPGTKIFVFDEYVISIPGEPKSEGVLTSSDKNAPKSDASKGTCEIITVDCGLGVKYSTKELVEENEQYWIYSLDNNPELRLKVFKAQISNDLKANLSRLSAAKTIDKSFVLPIHVSTVKIGGIEKTCYIFRAIPESYCLFYDVIRGKEQFDTPVLLVNAAQSFIKGMNSLHKSQLIRHGIEPKDIYLDCHSGNCLIVNNEFISKDYVRFNDAECMIHAEKAIQQGRIVFDRYSDLYSVGYIVTSLLAHTIIDGGDQDEIENRLSNVPREIKDLCLQSIDQNDRKNRPDLSQWQCAVEKWLLSLLPRFNKVD